MPAIQMDPGDHHQTLSHGWEGNVGKSYRSMQNKLIRAGMLKEAMLMDIADIKTQFGNKYDKAIAEMMGYSKCMGFI
ncbi:hypothetical protein KO488_00775 [Poseidonibacter lekithochrous]|uniref:hypothetical protein n=1 Tax=Poseidonibacter TaxID=2321187 RepID=UPI001C0A621C|nr:MULTISPECIES: hypothetical protein [Poseidonibacter]MBU3013270.1 hypothetical protein [Poseidonibacter lekithochrous]MDO6826567.1 hypothetical protein [Poseidonibacter sp. 1_MG-2023]